MTSVIEFIRERFTRTQPLAAGSHTYKSPGDEPAYRLHLRTMPDGSGVLVVNAATVLHLNPTATEYAYHLIKGSQPEEAARQVASRYNINRASALQDYVEFRDRIQALVHTPDLDPVADLKFERVSPHSQTLSAPLRLDCALTYKLPAGADTSNAPTKRVDRELTTDEWKTIIDKAWQAGIPHITLTGGEPTLRPDLAEIIAHIEKTGQVCGLLSDGLKLGDKVYLDSLLQTGLDHLLFILQPQNKASWKALEVILPEDLFTTVHLTVQASDVNKVDEYLDRLSKSGVTSLSLSTSDSSLRTQMNVLRNRASRLGLNLRWDLPVPYSTENPVAFETGEDNIPSGAGKSWLYVEPDGDVLPAQGLADQIMGNFLKNSFEEIYH
jgi:organic radical activating enzyme